VRLERVATWELNASRRRPAFSLQQLWRRINGKKSPFTAISYRTSIRQLLKNLAKHGRTVLRPFPKWSPKEALATMDRLGVETAFLSISSPGVHFGDDAAARTIARQVNEEGARLVREYPDRFGFFASTPVPDVEGAIAEVRYAIEQLGADGVSWRRTFTASILETNGLSRCTLNSNPLPRSSSSIQFPRITPVAA
jgi:predicted TIM-barrel fold metal-dependent hydrolase